MKYTNWIDAYKTICTVPGREVGLYEIDKIVFVYIFMSFYWI